MSESVGREPKVFVVDDDEGVRKSAARLFQAAGYSTASFAWASELLAVVGDSSAGCVVIDVRLPGVSGLELQQRLAERSPALSAIFLTGVGEVETIVRAMKNGALDFLIKPVANEVLLAAVQQAVQFSIAMQQRVLTQKHMQAAVLRLSPRERQVMAYVIGGYLNKQIAAELAIAEKTVKVHRGRIMEKMGARSVPELVRMCEHAGVEPSTLRGRPLMVTPFRAPPVNGASASSGGEGSS